MFLTELYQKSKKCQLEFKYALSCGKPFVFIFVEPNTVVEKWIEPHVRAWPTYELFKCEDFNILKNGIPRVNLIAQAIRDITFAQPNMIEFDLSEEVINLKELLNDALNEIDIMNAKSRFKLCTRCHKEYEEINPNGCKKHTAYYVGGSIIAGRWVCCNQTELNSIGCRDANHVDFERRIKLDPNYGTESWDPE